MGRWLLRVFSGRVIDESWWIWDLVAGTPSSDKSNHVIGWFEGFQFLSDSLTGLNVSWTLRNAVGATYAIILNADL
jgi:hypothetical protein